MAAHLDPSAVNSAGLRPGGGADRACPSAPRKVRLEALRLFCDVAETGSFSAAARKNQVGCDVVSYEVLALEHYFDVPLLERERENNRLTVAGRAVYDFSQQVLQGYAATEARIGELGGMEDEG
jgi:DNA-binding transcriptional LysR family regulator